MSRKGMGMTAIVDADGRVAASSPTATCAATLDKPLDLRATPVSEVMTRQPAHHPRRNAWPPKRCSSWRSTSINQMLVVDEDRRLVGALNMHDLLRAKVI